MAHVSKSKRSKKKVMAKRGSTSTARKGNARTAVQESVALSRELWLVKSALNINEEEHYERSMGLQDIIYNFTPEMQRLAYNSGFAYGELVANHFPSVSTLERILLAAGFGKVLYYPFETHAIITSKSMHTPLKLGHNVHYFESGLISGFMSTHLHSKIEVVEKHCALNTSNFCQFVASPNENPFSSMLGYEDLNSAARLLHEYSTQRTGGMSEPYYAFSLLPILQEPLLGEAVKLAYLLGKRLGEIEADASKQASLLALYMGLGSKLAIKSRGVKLLVDYPHSLSIGGDVDLSSALLRGYLSNVYKSRCIIERKANAKGTYEVKIETES